MEKVSRSCSLNNTNWLAVFENLQQNMLEAHRHLQQSLIESHRQFLQVTEIIAQQLSAIKNQFMQDKPTSVDTIKQALQNLTSSVSTINTTVKASLEQTTTKLDGSMPELSREVMQQIIIAMIVEKTYLPERLIDLDANLADLGIDSIQRIEIFCALEEHLPQLARVDLPQLANLMSVNAILDFVDASQKIMINYLDV